MDTLSDYQRLVKEAWSTSAKWKENYAEAAMVEFNKARNLTADARSLEAYFDPQAH